MRSLQDRLFSRNYVTSFVLHVVCVALWFSPFLFEKNTLCPISISFLGIPFLELSPLFASIFQFLLFVALGNVINMFLISFRLVPLQNKYFYFIFLFLMSVTLQVQSFSNKSIAFLFFLLSLFQLFRIFQSENVYRVFNSTFLLSIAVFFNVEYVYFFPFVIIALLLLRALTLRTFLSSLLGIFSVAFIFLSVFYLTDTFQNVHSYFALSKEMGGFDVVRSFSVMNFIGIGLLFFSLLFYVFSYISSRTTRSINVRSYSALINLLLIALFLVYIINFRQVGASLILILFSLSYFVTLFYIHRRSKFSNYSLIVMLSLGLAYRITELVLM